MTGALIWILMAIAPDGRMDFVSTHKDQNVCRQQAIVLSIQSKRYLKQPYSYTCMPGTPIQGSAR